MGIVQSATCTSPNSEGSLREVLHDSLPCDALTVQKASLSGIASEMVLPISTDGTYPPTRTRHFIVRVQINLLI